VSASEPIAGCRHCGSAILDRRAPAGFCCQGCAQVHGLILSCGLARYYELRTEAIAPVDATILRGGDFTWLRAAQSLADSAGSRSIRLGLRGVSCIGCVWLIEKTLGDEPGLVAARVNAHQAAVTIEWNAGADLAAAAEKLCAFGYLIVPEGQAGQAVDDGLSLRIGLCGAFAMNAMLNAIPGYMGLRADEAYAGVFRLLSAGCATLSLLVGGTFFLTRALASLKHRQLHMDLPISLGLLAAYFASFVGWAWGLPTLEYWDFVSLFTFLMLVGRWTQERAIETNRRRLPATSPQLRTVPVYADEHSVTPTRQAPVAELKAGQIYGVPAGQVAPVCGRLLDAAAELSLVWINGESEPVPYPQGRLIPSGGLNLGQHEIRVCAAEDWADSMVRKLSETSGDGAFRPRTLERILTIYLGTVIVIALLGFGLRGALTHDWGAALQSAISVLIVSCPCAIGLAFPLATELTVGALRRSGVYARDPRIWERALSVRRVVFDKTGTLSLETPRLTNPEALAELPAQARAALATLVDQNLHPFGRGLREALGVAAVRTCEGRLESIPGKGMVLQDAHGTRWTLGRPDWHRRPASPAAGSETEFCRNGERLALFSFAEEPRPHAAEEIAALRAQGLEVFVLSGDRPAKVAALLQAVGLPPSAGLGDLSPEQKATWIREHDGKHTLMLGDGANDALAFTEATLRGTPVVDLSLLEQKADFYLLGRDLRGLSKLFAMTRLRRRVLTEVFVFTVSYNVLVIALSLAGLMSPLLATVLMPASAILTLLHVTARLRRR
jgi:Cu2+-exporting ATPase